MSCTITDINSDNEPKSDELLAPIIDACSKILLTVCIVSSMSMSGNSMLYKNAFSNSSFSDMTRTLSAPNVPIYFCKISSSVGSCSDSGASNCCSVVALNNLRVDAF